MRTFFIFSVIALSITPALGMSTKEKVQMILWVKGIKENSQANPKVYSWPEEIEKPLRKF